MSRLIALAAAAAVMAGVPALAHTVARGDLTLSALELRASLGRNPNTGGYLTVENRGAQADALIAARCACARAVELHTMSHVGGVMRMDKVASLAVPARGRLELKPGGAHVMFLGLKQPLKAGTDVPVTLRFRRAGEVTTMFHVVATPTAAPAAGHEGH